MKVNSREQKIVEHARRIERLNIKRDKIAEELAEVDRELAAESDALRALLPKAPPVAPPSELRLTHAEPTSDEAPATPVHAPEALFAR